jgi:SAM-dependent methyltransferase
MDWSDPNYWQNRFDIGDTPWELGAPSKVLFEACAELEACGFLLAGKRVLSPGCGRGSDALELARHGAHVVAVDWSEHALNDLSVRFSQIKNSVSGSVSLVRGDFFSIAPQQVDVVCEHTFFCAIDPAARPSYVELLCSWVRPGGFLVGNFFIVSEDEARQLPGLSLVKPSSPGCVGMGPPFAATVRELEGLLGAGFVKVSLHRSETSEPSRRPGIEWVGVFRRL